MCVRGLLFFSFFQKEMILHLLLTSRQLTGVLIGASYNQLDLLRHSRFLSMHFQYPAAQTCMEMQQIKQIPPWPLSLKPIPSFYHDAVDPCPSFKGVVRGR